MACDDERSPRFSCYAPKTMFRTAFIGIFLFGSLTMAQQQPASSGPILSPPAANRPTLGPPALGEPAPKLSDEEVVARATRTAQATIHWDESSSQGVTVQTELLQKRDAGTRVVVQYHIKVNGAPHDQPFTLMA